MPDWSSYALSDFLPFSLATYRRIGTLYNTQFSIAVISGLTLGLAALMLLRRPVIWRMRLVLAGFGLSWLWISWAYQLQTLAPLLWAGELFALAFALQSGLLLAAARTEAPMPPRIGPNPGRQFGWALGYGMLGVAVLLLPMIELATGQPWTGLSLIGSAPVPTAIGTLGLAAMLNRGLALMLLPVPVLWSIAAALLQFGLDDPLWLLPAVAVPVGLVAVLSRRGLGAAGEGTREVKRREK